MTQGMIVGADAKIEWLLPWWWGHYSRHNSYPVTFVDFGMSQKMLNWCFSRGTIATIAFDETWIVEKSKIHPELIQKWEKKHGKDLWESRSGWFKKPFAMMQSPYDLSIWLDLDCEVCKNLGPLFQDLSPHCEVGMVDTQLDRYYNSGVVVFRKNSTLIKKWSELCISENSRFCGDDQIFNLALFEKTGFQELSQHYNWLPYHGINFGAFIIHWIETGKDFIKQYGGFQTMTKSLFNYTETT